MPVSRLRKPLDLTLSPASSTWLIRTAAKRGISRSRVVDELVAAAIIREKSEANWIGSLICNGYGELNPGQRCPGCRACS